ncbi:hypothetical protein DBR33_03465 [Stenotrophomonas sp. HMWF022]|nr:hypothetical protein DBR33_03465 [Stenotrophomonas sp. HMWF022]
MVKTWSSAITGNVTCDHCGRVFERSVFRSPMRDKDSYECACGETLERWNSTESPSFREISGPTK